MKINQRPSTLKKIAKGILLTSLAIAMAAPANGTLADETGTWVATWEAAPQPTWGGNFPLPTLLPFNLWNQTVRQSVRVSLGGDKVRVVLSNEYGDQPLTIDSVKIALAGAGSVIADGSSRTLTFSGSETVTIPAGAPMVSDPVELSVPSRGDLTVSFFVANPTPIETYHWDGQQTSYIAAGNQVDALELSEPAAITTRIFLSDVMVEAAAGAGTVVAFGDSITDGAASGMDQNTRWPDFLAENLAPMNVSVVNAGISGARVLNTIMGENALARFDREVLARPNVKSVVVLMGINDIAWPGQTFDPDGRFLVKEELISAYRQMALRARLKGVRMIIGTLTPFKDALKGSPLEGYYNEKRDALRMEVNEWLRANADEFDAVVDLDKLVQKEDDPAAVIDAYQADYLHLSAEGNKVVADALTPEILFGNK